MLRVVADAVEVNARRADAHPRQDDDGAETAVEAAGARCTKGGQVRMRAAGAASRAAGATDARRKRSMAMGWADVEQRGGLP